MKQFEICARLIGVYFTICLLFVCLFWLFVMLGLLSAIYVMLCLWYVVFMMWFSFWDCCFFACTACVSFPAAIAFIWSIFIFSTQLNTLTNWYAKYCFLSSHYGTVVLWRHRQNTVFLAHLLYLHHRHAFSSKTHFCNWI